MRRRVLVLCTVQLAAGAFLTADSGQADEQTVPITLQVDLLGRVVRFERNDVGRGSAPALVVVVAKGDETASVRAAALASAAIEPIGSLGARPASVGMQTFSSPAALRSASREADIVYWMPGFGRADLQAIAATFADSNVLTVDASSSDAENGAAPGLSMTSSRELRGVSRRD